MPDVPSLHPASLETSQFQRAVHALSPKVAVFDCDGTLWSGDAGSAFMRWTVENGLVATSAAAWLRERYEGYEHGAISELAICGDMVRVFAGIPETRMRSAARTFFAAEIEPHIFPEMLDLVHQLRAAESDIWAVSSTCQWVIEEGVRRFSIPPARVLAARVRVTDGIVTDELLDVPTDEGKVAALQAAGVTHPDAVFGNSIHDAAMLAIARRAFPVNPSPALVERSLQQRWPIFYPASVRPALA